MSDVKTNGKKIGDPEMQAECDEYLKNMTGIGPDWENDIKEIILTEKQIADRIDIIAAQINRDYAGKNPIFVGLLKGAFLYMADLLRKITIKYQADFMALSSYSGQHSTGNVKCNKDIGIDPEGRHIIVVEDLIDTGGTLAWMKKHLKSKNPASVKITVLLDKIARRTADVEIDYAGFDCPDVFVIGYGMDYDDDYRCLPFVGVLKESVYSGEHE